jgi:hypothetical protein
MPAMTGATRHTLTRSVTLACLLVALAGCASAPMPPAEPVAPPPAAVPPVPPVPPPAPAPQPAGTRYHCDHDAAFTVEYGDDAATLAVTGRPREVLPRDAGGVTPRQTVYSSERVRAEFGLGPRGDEAVLRYAEPPLVLHCSRG